MMKTFRTVAVLISAVLVAAACAAPRAGSGATTAPTGGPAATATSAPDFTGKTLNVVTGGTGGVYITYGAGLVELLNKKLKTAAAAQSTAASVANMQLIRDGKADLAFTLSDTAYDAVAGKGATFTDKKARGPVHELHTHHRQGWRGHQHRRRSQGEAGLGRRSGLRHGDHREPHP